MKIQINQNTMKTKLFILFTLLYSNSAFSQKTKLYFEYSLYPENVHADGVPMTQPLNENEYYWIHVNRNGANLMDSLKLRTPTKPKGQTIKILNKNADPCLVLFMDRDSALWNLVISPQGNGSYGKKLHIVNILNSNNDLLVFFHASADSLNLRYDNIQESKIDLPDTAGYGLLRISKNAKCSLENFIQSHVEYGAKPWLLCTNENTYNIYMPYYHNQSNLPYKLIPENGRLLDSQVTAFVLQFEFGKSTPKNWISGSLPVLNVQYSTNNLFVENRMLLVGNYYPDNKFWNQNFPFHAVYKIGINPIQTFKKPDRYSKDITYIFSVSMDKQDFTNLDVQYFISPKNNYPAVSNYGFLKNGFWLQVANCDSIRPDNPTVKWHQIKSKINQYGLLSYNLQTNTLVSQGFPEEPKEVYSDGDSLLIISGDNAKSSNPNNYIDFDQSSNFNYSISKGKYTAQFDLNGNVVWARSENITTNSHRPTVYKSTNNAKILCTAQPYKKDVEYGFRTVPRWNLNDVSGLLVQISKAPICDFEIVTINNNYVHLNYKGALNANFYYKYSDGSKDSNRNERTQIHRYAKTGTYLIYCIAQNQYGSDTAYYSVTIDDVNSFKKLHTVNNTLVYPNPAENIITWKLTNTQEVDIFDAAGKRVYSKKTNLNTLDISHLKTGTYLIVIHTQHGSFCTKIIHP
jgi:hypothetical protein